MKNCAKILVQGTGGHGVRLLMSLLTKMLSEFKQVTLIYDYDSAVRGGYIDGSLIFADNAITCPIIDQADLIINLNSNEIQEGEKSLTIDIQEEKKKFAALRLNMFYLGFLIKWVGLDLKQEQIKQLLGKKFSEENFSSIEAGFAII